jgi:DNA-directed RNA polymerase subunit A'
MNAHVPQTPQARMELEELSSTQNHILSFQNGQANTVLVQDSVLGLYLMTKENECVSEATLNDLTMHLVDEKSRPWELHRLFDKLDHIRSQGVDPHSGFGLVSLCFPSTFSMTTKKCRIEKGVFVEGVFEKKGMAKAVKVAYHVHGPTQTMMMLNNLQFIANQWLIHRSFTVGLGDCMSTQQGLIHETVLRCFTEANGLEETTHHAGIREVRVQNALNKARDIGLKLCKDGLREDNHFLDTVNSGAKGDIFNIAQIAGLLGQQNFRGGRIENALGDRSLFHYPRTITNDKDKYESRGFIRHSFVRGLNPREMYFHAVPGREGITDTALGTGDTGYMQRRIVKLMEDIHVKYDGTVRDETNKIYQFVYGENNEECTGQASFREIVTELNSRVELQ